MDLSHIFPYPMLWRRFLWYKKLCLIGFIAVMSVVFVHFIGPMIAPAGWFSDLIRSGDVPLLLPYTLAFVLAPLGLVSGLALAMMRWNTEAAIVFLQTTIVAMLIYFWINGTLASAIGTFPL